MRDPVTPRYWYLVHAKTGSETLAAEHLARQAFRTFFPRTWRTIRHARKIRNVVSAYFPGYLFVEIDKERGRWRAINSTVGVIRLVSANGAPTPAPPGLIETLQAATDERGFIELARTLSPGEEVRVLKGPFADQLGVVDRLDPDGRVRLLLDLMNAKVPVSLDREAVARQ